MKKAIFLLCGLTLIFLPPLFRKAQTAHIIKTEAKAKGIWQNLPQAVPSKALCIEQIKQHGIALKIKITQDANEGFSIQSKQLLPVCELLHRINQMPTVLVKQCDLRNTNKEWVGKIKLAFPVVSNSTDMLLKHDPNITCYKSRYHYVNAMTHIEGHTQLWINGCSVDHAPCPLYHTFDSKTGKIHKGDHRPKLGAVSQ